MTQRRVVTVAAGSLPMLLVAFILMVGSGCGKVCPEGTIRVGDYCKRVNPDVVVVPDVIITSDIVVDSVDDDASEIVGPDAADTVSQDLLKDDGGKVDTNDPIEYPGDYIGRACNKPSECSSSTWPDGKCLSWPKGFCAMPGCDADLVCPEGSVCMGLAAGSNSALCTITCEDDSDCRQQTDALGNGYSCKKVPDPDGVFQSVCYMEAGDANDVGGPCQAHEDCLGRMGCLPNFDGGYCAELTCDAANPCPDGTVCTRLQGRGVCMKTCVTGDDCLETRPCTEDDIDCTDGVVLSRACIQMKSAIDLSKVMVCGSGTVGKEIGEQCLNETECKSGKCNVSYTGKCSDFMQTGRRCLSDVDCAITKAICAQNPADTYGFCTADCGFTQCASSVCVMSLKDESTLAGMCVPQCQPLNPEDPFSESDCWEEAGLRCMWGDTKFQPNVRSCVRIDPGDPGMNCRNDSECYSGNCIGEDVGTDGVCAMNCLSGDTCPFPTVCQTVGDARLCMKRCLSGPDCPGTMTCQVNTMGDYCVPASM